SVARMAHPPRPFARRNKHLHAGTAHLDGFAPASVAQTGCMRQAVLPNPHLLCIDYIHSMNTRLHISQTDARPMYLQIMEQVRARIASGDWAAGRELPSIRAMAAALEVSVITVKRAYLELEQEGLIVTRHGKGSFVAASGRVR